MRIDLVRNLCCPECRGDVEFSTIAQSVSNQIIEGSLVCKICGYTYKISDGIPILLPANCSNIREREMRDTVSEEVGLKWESLYDVHHFRKLSQLRIRHHLSKIDTTSKPKILDIGIGWGVNYLPYTHDIDLFGLDFSYGSLLVLKRIYERNRSSIPNLLCASLSAIPLKNLRFNLIWSTQVYQHIPDIKEIHSSFDYIINSLLDTKGVFVVDNFNFNYRRFLVGVASLFRSSKREPWQEKQTDTYYVKYYTENDLIALTRKFEGIVTSKIIFTENLFHPELKLVPRSHIIALADDLVRKTPFAKFFGRQISLEIYRK